MSNNYKNYWASLPASNIADEILEKVDNYYKFLSMSGRLDLMRRSWSYYYRPRLTGARLNPTGEQGELTSLSVNHYRSLLNRLETMTIEQRPSFEPKATNSDVKSQSQVILATGLLDYYMREKQLEDFIKLGTKDALIFGEAFVRAEWDATSGKEYGQTDTGAVVYEGDIKYSNYTPLDCIRDFTKNAHKAEDWYVLRDVANKYDLAAKFPALEEDILDDSVDLLEYAATTTLQAIGLDDSDNIFVYTLIHKPTPALPQGRFCQVLDNCTVLMDGPLPYDETHVYRIAPDEETGTIFGYSVGFDLLAVQEGIDMLYSTVITNQSTFGVQNILVPKGHDISTSQMSGGLNVMEYDKDIGKPESLNLTQTPPEIFNFIQQLERTQETLSYVNSVARGNPEASLKSGAALALVQSQAIQATMNLQQSYVRLVENLGTGTIKILQKFAAVPRVAEIAGKSNRPLMREFSGQDLDAISRVQVDLGNPLTRTIAGKVNLADALAEKGMIDNPDQYIQVITTGRLEPIIEGKQAQMLLIKSENEQLAEGRQQRALVTDNHQKHILEHTTVLSNPEIRMDPNNPIVAVTLAHIQEHMDMMNDPNVQRIGAILHQEVVPGQPPQPAPAQAPGAVGEAMEAVNPVTAQAGQINPPNMPAPPQGADPVSAEIINANRQGT